MSASLNDKITDTRNSARPNIARSTGVRAVGGTTLACDSLAGWPTASKVHFVTYKINALSEVIPGTQIDGYGIVSGNSINSFTVVDGTDSGNSIGEVVEMLPTAGWGQDLSDALNAEHNRDGTHKSITTNTITVSSGTTLPAGDIGSADIATSAITAIKIAPNVITSDKMYNPIAFRALKSGQSVTGSTWTLAAGNSEVYDYGSNYNTGTFRFVAPVNGVYAFSGTHTGSGPERRIAEIRLNGGSSAYDRGQDVDINGGVASGNDTTNVATEFYMNAGDYAEFWVWVDDTASTNTRFTGHLVGQVQ